PWTRPGSPSPPFDRAPCPTGSPLALWARSSGLASPVRVLYLPGLRGPIAQQDRAAVSYTVGQRFESSWGRQEFSRKFKGYAPSPKGEGAFILPGCAPVG